MEAFVVSTFAILLSEIGDKTQLLALMLAIRFKKPVTILLGIFCATLANHTTAGAVGAWIANNVSEEVIRWILAASFILIGLWALKPDKLEEPQLTKGYGVFTITLVAFFLAEIGDKTQIATVMLALKFNDLLLVVAGTTLGMILADLPAVYLGKSFADKIPLKPFRIGTAIVFITMGLLALAGVGA